jgi:putative Holliday junction resolvase
MPIYLALDIGKKRTGIARSDHMGIVIKPFKTIFTENLIQELGKIDEELGIEKLIIGEPINIGDGNNEALTNVREQVHLIQQSFNKIKIELIDERFTSKEAEAIIKQKGIFINKENKELIDQYAAAIILETYWQFKKND